MLQWRVLAQLVEQFDEVALSVVGARHRFKKVLGSIP